MSHDLAANWRGPDPKERVTQRGPKRYRRKIASSKQWAAIMAEKVDGRNCRVCGDPNLPGHGLDSHHVIPRVTPWFGPDVAWNIVPVGHGCHDRITRREPASVRLLLESLDDEEYAAILDVAGEEFFERYYQLRYSR